MTARRELGAGPTLLHELVLWRSGVCAVAGLDEAGRGALAGPVVAAAVVLEPESDHDKLLDAGVRDSKELTPTVRRELAPLICDEAAGWGVGVVSAGDIDHIGIVPATLKAMELALQQLPLLAEALLIDYVSLPNVALPQQPIVHGDQLSLSIAAASVLAKVARDQILTCYDGDYPGYGFARHKGYGTPEHRAALLKLGPCPLHRRTFRPVVEVWPL